MVFAEPDPEQRVTQMSLPPLVAPDSSGKANYVSERRSEPRVDLTVAVLVVPMDGDLPDISRAFTAITKDVSNDGIGVIAHRFLLTPEVLIYLWREGELRLLRAAVRHRKELSRGWGRFGVDVTGTLEKNEYPELRRFIGTLLGCS